MSSRRLRIAVEGVVQGVGFRPFVYGLADRLGVRGFVANRAGDVVIEAEAEDTILDRFLVELRERAPSAARVDRVTTAPAIPRGERVFAIVASETGDSVAAIGPDIATCDACIAEILDPASRRYHYPFTSCAACGPRLTIVTAAPYDRARTTMAHFPMCAQCRVEHDDPRDRRFHAQPIACPACGPHLDEPLANARAVLAAGGIVAVKGLGGYHLACDATNEVAVAELRRRKHRDAKPFAVMVRDIAAAHALAELSEPAVALLESPARPIVLAPSRDVLPRNVAPGVGDIGLMLPYTPLHHLLLGDNTPLVMTSGNVTDEPIAYRDDDARTRLTPIADRFVTHDREIHMRCEDSVTRIVGGAPMILRRARGYAPAPMRLPFSVDVPTLALGGHLKSAFALASGDIAFVSPHFGDLDDLSAYEAFVAALDHFQALHRITPQRLACDLHPDYATTRLAEELGADRSIPIVRVQHHHAHLASVLADASIDGPAIGVIFDGAGYGCDGAIWGGEILVGDRRTVRRAAHLAYVPQPGGDRAACEPWRMAIAHSLHAGIALDAKWFGDGGRDIDAIAAMCRRPALSPPTSSMGRLFDAAAAMVGITDASFEGQAAMRLEALARACPARDAYPFEIHAGIAGMMLDAPDVWADGRCDQIDVAPMIRAIATDIGNAREQAVIARRFHSTVVEMSAQVVERIARAECIRDVVLSGGVFQNAILVEELPRRLAGLRVHVHRRVPPNDGGLSLGQLAIAGGG